jgi:hypothetical protein
VARVPNPKVKHSEPTNLDGVGIKNHDLQMVMSDTDKAFAAFYQPVIAPTAFARRYSATRLGQSAGAWNVQFKNGAGRAWLWSRRH